MTRSISDVLSSLVRARSASLPKILSREDLQRTLDKERTRADRSGRAFYWVLFRLGDSHSEKQVLQRLGDIVARRIRSTDTVGWFDETVACAILLDTDRTGAQVFATDILRLVAELHIKPKAVIYSYPLEDSSTGDSPTNQPPAVLSDDHILVAAGVTSSGPQQNAAVREPFLVSMPRWKRAMDIIGASIGLLLTAPILLLAAVAIKISSPGPVLFVQRRTGLGGRPFSIYKFRTMHVGAEALKAQLRRSNERDGPAFKIKNDPRLIPIGSFLRRLSVDELPQLFNVLKGDMSLVGPRPATFDETIEYRSWYQRRLDVTPGLTCIWQVRGRAEITFESWMRMDIQYIRHYGFWQDLRLLLATIPAVLTGRGAY